MMRTLAAALMVVAFACGGSDKPAPAVGAAPAPTETAIGSEAAPAPQESLHDRVHRALSRAPSLEGSDIRVRVEGSTVYLEGHVHSPEQRKIAHDVAHAVDGVSSVHFGALAVR